MMTLCGDVVCLCVKSDVYLCIVNASAHVGVAMLARLRVACVMLCSPPTLTTDCGVRISSEFSRDRPVNKARTHTQGCVCNIQNTKTRTLSIK